MTDRKKIPVDCPNCGVQQRNCFVLAAHKGWCSGLRQPPTFGGKRNNCLGKRKHSASEVLTCKSKFTTGFAKRTFLETGITYECHVCQLSTWMNKDLVLELDHINGISNDHRIQNLRLLCPNCHSQTSTFRGKNREDRQVIDDQTLLNALLSTKNIRQALQLVGLAPKGGNYKRCYQLLSSKK